MTKFIKISILLTLFFSCNIHPNSSINTQDSTAKNNRDKENIILSDSLATNVKTEIKRGGTNESNVFEEEVGMWVFVKSFLDKDFDTFITYSFTIYRVKIESAGYAYFVRFSKDEQEYLLTKLDENTLVYGQDDSSAYTGAFVFDIVTGHLFVKISDVSNAEYKKKDN